ncbi:hypothetical protein [Streptomyces sp. KAU_LT]|uniref:hypothetical protein n=1 Tax=Streptomyces sp. KAU_LT TaxID=3046669 RepID=UPI0024B80EB5|nr:hypothetical protein [Streptomyces sp. KAU_LT]MDI9829698.1 hypothetical protein [Streptomyces sp. KAU_LT]
MPDTPTPGSPDEAPNGRPLQVDAPPGHSIIAHQVHGWCSACPDIEVWEELLAWRNRERARMTDAPYTDRAPQEVAPRG